MRKFLTKAKIQLVILVFTSIGIITIAGNISLAVNREALNKKISGYFKHDISVGPALYIFPNCVIFRDIVVHKTAVSADEPNDRLRQKLNVLDSAGLTDKSGESKDGSTLVKPAAEHKNNSAQTPRSSFTLSKIKIHFSLLSFFIGEALRISSVTLSPSVIDYYALGQFLEDNVKEILEVIRNSPDDDIKIRIKEVLLDIGRNGEPDYVTTELVLAVQGDSINGTGLLRTDQNRFSARDGSEAQRATKGWSLWYKVRGELKSDGLAIDHLILKNENYYSKLWGSARNGLVKVNGFMFVDMARQNSKETNFSPTRHLNNFPIDNAMSNIDVYVLDIDGQVAFSFPDIIIDQFYFTVNNNPVMLKGNISLRDPLTANADLSIQRSNTINDKSAFFERADMNFSGTWRDNTLNTNGQVNISFFENDNLSFSPKKAQVTFADFNFRIDQHKQIIINLADGNMTYWIRGNKHKVSIQDFKAIARTKMEGLKVIEMDSPFYNGTLNGIVKIDSTQMPSKVTSEITLDGVDTGAMEELLIHFAKFNGRISSTMNFTSDPLVNLSGDISVFDGQMTDFHFFNWVGDTFRLPALNAIDFDKASAQFSINKEHFQLRNIRLTAEDVRIEGYFDIDHKNLVSSDLTLTLSQTFLRQSPKFRPILKIFEKDDSYLDFDFQLSGSPDTMNFRWLPSPDKKKIQMRIPDFVERSIEKNIDQMMEADLQTITE